MTRSISVGLAALGLAICVAILAWLGTVPTILAVVASDAVVVGLGCLAVVAGLGALYGGAESPETDDTEAVATAAPLGSTETADERERSGGQWSVLGSVIGGPKWKRDREYVDETFRRALERPTAGSDRRPRRRYYYRNDARTAVVETAVAVLARRRDVDREAATTMLREGRWTDDPRAAAFVEGSVRLPLRTRIVDWAYGARYRRGLEAAVREVERLADGGDPEADREGSADGSEGTDADREDAAPSADDYGTDAWLEADDTAGAAVDGKHADGATPADGTAAESADSSGRSPGRAGSGGDRW